MPTEPFRVHYLGRGRAAQAASVWNASDTRPDVLLLSGLSVAYRGVTAFRRSAYERGWLRQTRVSVPVISVGNLAVGGAGKTPFARWLVTQLRSLGQKPALLHGGYGADEPALHRRWLPDLPVYAARDRSASAASAIAAGATVLVLDDALQHLRLARDLDLVLISADTWDQPRRLLPAGAWREPVEAIPVDALVVVTRKAATEEQAQDAADEIRQNTAARVIAIAALELAGLPEVGTSGVVALASIADPMAFARQLLLADIAVDELLAFDDHHDYTAADVQQIKQLAAGRRIVTTEKDAVKLDLVAGDLQYTVAQQKLVLESGAAELMAAVRGVLK